MRTLILFLLLAGCAAQQESIEPVPEGKSQEQEMNPPQEIEPLNPECRSPLLTGNECAATECARNGGRCQESNGCFRCIEPPCPEGTGPCDASCGSCMKVAQAGSKECFACVGAALCPQPYYDDAALCDATCGGSCVMTNAVANTKCFECRGAV